MIAAAVVASMLAVAGAQGASDGASLSEAALFHVRARDARAQSWIRAGVSASRTFRTLIDRLAGSDVIVYVEIVDRIPGGAAGQMYFVTATATTRYVRIEVIEDGSPNDMVVLVGHELQHAVEVADAPRVRDRQSLATLYMAMGENGFSRTQYDSIAARVTEERVRTELSGYRGFATGSPAQTLARLKTRK